MVHRARELRPRQYDELAYDPQTMRLAFRLQVAVSPIDHKVLTLIIDEDNNGS